MEKKRLYYIDIAKGIAIFLVVLGHTYRGNIVQNWLYSFHMPLFFFISGWLYEGKNNFEDGFPKFVLKRTRRLLIPYFVFLMLNFVYWIIVERHFRSFDRGPLWFLPVLLIDECIVAVVVNEIKNNNRKKLCAFLFFVVILLCIGNLGIDYDGIIGWMVRCYNGIVWYYAGFCVSGYIKEKSERFLINRSSWLYILFFLFLNLLFGCNNGRVDMYENRFNDVFLYVLAAFSGIFFCFGISAVIGRNKALEYLGKNSLIIMCTHEPIKRAIIQVISILTHASSESIRNNILIGFIIAIFVVFVEIIVIEILRLLSRATKGKRIHIFFEYIK